MPMRDANPVHVGIAALGLGPVFGFFVAGHVLGLPWWGEVLGAAAGWLLGAGLLLAWLEWRGRVRPHQENPRADENAIT